MERSAGASHSGAPRPAERSDPAVVVTSVGSDRSGGQVVQFLIRTEYVPSEPYLLYPVVAGLPKPVPLTSR